MISCGLLHLYFGSSETSDFWCDCLKAWWESVRSANKGARRLIIYLDNGPKNSGVRKQFMRRLVEFADWSGLELHLIYYPPYHSKYNPIERCWSSLQRKWNGVLLTCWAIVRKCAERMKWNDFHPTVNWVESSVRPEPTRSEWDRVNERISRSESLPKHDIKIMPKTPRGR
jgi:transposase